MSNIVHPFFLFKANYTIASTHIIVNLINFHLPYFLGKDY